MSTPLDLRTDERPLGRLASGDDRLVFAWRLDQLVRAGFDDDDAVALALRTDVDLHRALELTRRGCSPALASQIML